MKIRHSCKNSTSSGFSLIEVLVVISIIAVLTAITIAGLGTVKKKSNDKRTLVLIHSIENALEAYNLDNNEFPDGDGSITSSNELYQTLYGDYDNDGISDQGEEIYCEQLDPNLKPKKNNISKTDGFIIIDAWQNPIYYKSPGDMNPDFDIWSLGPDNKGGPNSSSDFGLDDIDNY